MTRAYEISIKVSDRLIGHDNIDCIVFGISAPDGIADLVNVSDGSHLIVSLRDLEYAIQIGDVVIAASQTDLRQRLSSPLSPPFATALERVEYYCRAVDKSDARFALGRCDYERIAALTAAIAREFPPSPDRLRLWWRAWVLANRQPERLAVTLGSMIGEGMRYDA